MTPADLITKLTADAERLQTEIAHAQQYLAERQTLLLKTQGGLETLALLDQDDEATAVTGDTIRLGG